MAQGTRIIPAVLAAIALAACGHNPPVPEVKVKSKLETAIENVKDEWLKPCGGVGAVPTNNVGNLLQDAADVAAAGAICAARHNSFIDYIAPVVREQKSLTPAK